MKMCKKILCSLLVIIMCLTAAPLDGLADLKLPNWFSSKAEAASIGTYCSTAAVEYARKYALSYNKEWYFYVNGGDCANFVSQSLFVAGVPMTSRWHSYDCNSTAYVMSNSYTWIRAHELMEYLVSIGGVRINNPSPSDFSLGDAVFYDWNSNGGMDHSAIVTKIDGGVPKVSCHSTPEMQSKLDAHWTLGKNKSCAVLIKLGGKTCVNNNAPDYDIYKLNTSTGLYSSPGSGFLASVSSRHTVRVTEKTNIGGKTWGKFNYKGTWGWIDLSKGTYKGHFDRIQVDHLFGGWYVVKQATCVEDGLERRDCSRCGYQQERPIKGGGHVSRGPATCTTAEVCKACGITMTPALGHSFTDWVLKTAPNCTQKAVYERTCIRGDRTETKIGDYGNHNYMANVTPPNCTTSGGSTMKCTYCGDSYIEDSGNVWSGWTTERYEGLLSDPSLYEAKTQYRYIDKQTQNINGTTNSNYTISGWAQQSKNEYWSDYGGWSDWQDSPISSSESRQVDTRTVGEVTYKTVYHYFRYSTARDGTNGSDKPTDKYGKTRYDYDFDYELIYEGSMGNNARGYQYYYSAPTGNTIKGKYITVWKEDPFTTQEVASNTERTQYRYRDRYKLYNYVFYRWPAWTDNWQDTPVSATENRQVQTRTVYRYKLAALGHDFGSPEVKQPGCLDKGYTQRVCNRCSFAYKYDYTNALGHDWCDWYTVIEAAPGQAGVERRDCRRCGIYETRGHNLQATVIAPTCTEQGYTIYKCADDGCTVEYKTEYTNALGHDLRNDAPEVTKYPTCTEAGEEKITCTRCNYYETKAIDPLGHDYDRNNDGKVDADDAVKTVAATCLKDGYRYFECENASEHNYTETIEATGHNMSKWNEVVPETCGDEGYKWRECQNEYCDISVEVRETTKRYYEEKDNWFLSHKYGELIIHDPECLEDGYSTQTCEICDNTIMYIGEKALGHDWGEWYTVSEATCTEEGITRRQCNRCKILEDEVSPMLGHDDESEDVYATCINASYTKVTCKRCHRVETTASGDIDPNAHDMGEWYLEKAATCTEVGYNRRDCQRNCGYFEREPISINGHDYKETSRTEPTCTQDGKIINECQNDNCDSQIVETINKHGHKFSTTIVDPTCTEKGYTLYECQRENCNYSEKREETPALGHDMGQWTVKTKPTATTQGVERRDCSRGDYFEERPIPVLEKLVATFVADGVVVSKVEFYAGDTKLSYEPDVPEKDRYTGVWENYTLGDSDITINAKYTLIPPDGLSEIETEKQATPNEETRDVTIKLTASSDAKTVVSETTEKTPLDIILVVDRSGSMAGDKNKKLVDSMNAISDLIYEEAKMNNVDHRLAIVGFAMGARFNEEFPKYENTEVLTTGGAPVQYSDEASEKLNNAYKNALVSVNKNGVKNDVITKAISTVENVTPSGATAANLGLTMAANIFAQNSIEGTNRNRIVIFMTDGEPTSWSEFDVSGVANPAIKQANQLKSAGNFNGCNATIYSVGITCGTSDNKKFLNAVSSNYDYVESMSSKLSTDTNDYFFYSDNVADLENMFTEIVTRSMINTTDFKDITLVDTISKSFTMTTQQEAALRESVIADYGVDNSNISVVRNADGTTTIKISNIDPKPVTGADGKVKYVAEVSFTVSANANALVAGTYETNTEDAGIIMGDAKTYEKLFEKQSATFNEDKGAAIFKINDKVYQITSVEIGGTVVPPDYRIESGYSFSKWDVPEDYVLNGGSVEFNATLDKTYTVKWIIDGKVQTDTYYEGDIIYAPEVTKNADGVSFTGWNIDVPVTMPGRDLEFTACYAVHTHAYNTVVSKKETCTEDGLLTHTCSCGDSYTEKVPNLGGEHEWLAITGAAALDNLSLEEFRCNKCNAYMSKSLVYEVQSAKKNYKGEGKSETIYDLSMYNATGEMIQPGTKVKITMPVPEGMENAKWIKVYRIDENGKRIELESTYSAQHKTITFVTDHFCMFAFVCGFACENGIDHSDANGDSICDDCMKSFRCSWCDRYEKEKDTPFIGWIITVIHYFIHLANTISIKT